MLFDEFSKKLGSAYKPDQAYKFYLQIKISILEQFIRKQFNMSDEAWDKLQNDVFESVLRETNKLTKK